MQTIKWTCECNINRIQSSSLKPLHHPCKPRVLSPLCSLPTTVVSRGLTSAEYIMYNYVLFPLNARLRVKTQSWLVGCFGFNGPLRQYFSLYRAISQREGERKEKDRREKKCPNNPHPHLLQGQKALALLLSKLVIGRLGTGSLPRTIATPDHPHKTQRYFILSLLVGITIVFLANL